MSTGIKRLLSILAGGIFVLTQLDLFLGISPNPEIVVCRLLTAVFLLLVVIAGDVSELLLEKQRR